MSVTFDGLTALEAAVEQRPELVLKFYSYGIIMCRTLRDGGCTEYAVSPAQLATALATKVTFQTGLLSANTLYIGSEGIKKLVAEYRAPQRTALYLDGSDTPLYAPLPGLVMLRGTTANDNPRYAVYAVRSRPTTLDAVLYLPPLPNLDQNGVCWGSVKKASPEALAGIDLAEDWRLLLGSVFTNHNCHGKSKSYPDDVRKQLVALEQRQCRKYPMRDLTRLKLTLGQVLAKAGLT